MYQPDKQPNQNLRSHRTRTRDAQKLFNTLRALDRTVVAISMQIYKVPQRDRAVMLKLHRRLHDSIQEGLAGSMDQPQSGF